MIEKKQELPSVAPPTQQPTASRTPVRQPTLEADVFVPFITGALGGFLAGVFAGWLSYKFGAARWWEWGITAFVIFTPLIAATRIILDAATFWKVEEWLGRDINGDGRVGNLAHGLARNVADDAGRMHTLSVAVITSAYRRPDRKGTYRDIKSHVPGLTDGEFVRIREHLLDIHLAERVGQSGEWRLIPATVAEALVYYEKHGTWI